MGIQFKFLHFKSFLDMAEIDLAPITLIYGENSSGKSTIIDCLRMIKQSGSSRINTKPRKYSQDDIDLGEPNEILTKIKYNRDNDEKLKFPNLFNYHFIFSNSKTSIYDKQKNIGKPQRSENALENIMQKFEKMTNEEIFRSDNPDQKDFLTDGNLEDLKIVKCFTFDPENTKNFNYDFGRIEINGGSSGMEFSLSKEIEKENIGYDYEEFGDTSVEENRIIRGSIPATYGVQFDYDFESFENLKEDNFRYSVLHPKGDYYKIWFPLIKEVIRNSDSLINAIQNAKAMSEYKLPIKSFNMQQRRTIPFQGLSEISLDKLLNEINSLLLSHTEYCEDPRIDYDMPDTGLLSDIDTEKYYSYDFDKSCSHFCSVLFNDLCGFEDGALPRDNLGESTYHFKHMLKGGWYGQYLSIESSLIEHISRQLKVAVFDPIIYFFLADRFTLEIFKRFKFISGIKKPSSRDFQSISTGSKKQNLNNDASNLAEILFHNKSVLNKLNDWLKNSHFKCFIEINEIRRDIYEMTVFDAEKKDAIGINIKDSGSGLYNMLPIITQSYLSKNPSFIAVEEPEVTLHPKIQIALADFIATMTKEKENTYLIETHSEHLLLNLMQLIKEGKIPNSWLNVYVTTKDNEGSHIHKMSINENGEFTSPWPGGFFEDRENLLMK